MIRAFALVMGAALTLSGCDTGPNFGIGLGFGAGGVSVSPSVSGRIGQVSVGAAL